MWHCAHSYFEKGCRKKCTRQSPKVLLVVLSTLFFNSKKNKIIAREPMNVRELNYRKVTKVDLTATTSGALYWSYPVLRFGIVACKFFRQPFSKQLYLHVFSLKSISDFNPDSHLIHRHECLACTLKRKSFIKSYTKWDVNLVLQYRVWREVTFYRTLNLRLTWVPIIRESFCCVSRNVLFHNIVGRNDLIFT